VAQGVGPEFKHQYHKKKKKKEKHQWQCPIIWIQWNTRQPLKKQHIPIYWYRKDISALFSVLSKNVTEWDIYIYMWNILT
jgi:hypothetical protein